MMSKSLWQRITWRGSSRLGNAIDPRRLEDLMIRELLRQHCRPHALDRRRIPGMREKELSGRLPGKLVRYVRAEIREQRTQLLDRSRLLNAPEHPRADVVACAVVEVSRALGGQKHTEAGRAGTPQQALERLLGRGLRRGREIHVRLVEHDDGLQPG